MNYSMELPFNLAKPNDYLAKYNLVVSVLIQACMYIQCMYEYMVHPHCGLFWEGGGGGGCDRDEGHDGFLTGGGVSMGRRADVTVFVK